MKRIIYILFVLTVHLNAQPYAFPKAYGAGANATGGRGYAVYHVTNLNNSGSGSLRQAIADAKTAGGGNIVFDVSGTIETTGSLQFDASNLTVAGQTSPSGGITIVAHTVNPSGNVEQTRLINCNNVILRHLRFRNEFVDDVEVDALQTRNIYNVIIDHCSFSYGTDEGFNAFLDPSNTITIQRCLVAESKTGSILGDSNDLNISYNISVLNNLFYNISHRTPNVAGNGRFDVINNVTHNWVGTRTIRTSGTSILLNDINNYYSTGERTAIVTGGGQYQMNQISNESATNEIYTSGNIVDKDLFTNPLADNKLLWSNYDLGVQNVLADPQEFTSTQHTLLGRAYTIKTATEAYADVISNVGCNARLNADGTVSANIDANDTAYLAKMTEGEGAYEDYVSGDFDAASWFNVSGGTPYTRYSNFVSSISSTPLASRDGSYDTDSDGMPDVWEAETFGDLSRTGTGDLDGDGYTDLEEFLNLVDGVEETPLPPAQRIKARGGKIRTNNGLMRIKSN